MLYYYPTLSLKDESHRQRFFEDSLSVLKNGSCEHTTNDLPTFSPQKRNLEIGLSERLLPVVGTKNRILKKRSSERALRLHKARNLAELDQFQKVYLLQSTDNLVLGYGKEARGTVKKLEF